MEINMAKEKCRCCDYNSLEEGATLLISLNWDSGYAFEEIRDIKYCPVCGKKLPEEWTPNEE